MDFDTNKLVSAGLAPSDVDPRDVAKMYKTLYLDIYGSLPTPSADAVLQTAYLICTNKSLYDLMRAVLSAAGLDLEDLEGDG